MVAVRLTGGCLCGALRYEVEPAGGIADLCHCSDCRRATGAVLVGWLQVAPAAFRLTQGEPQVFASSATGRRLFCGACGAHVAMTDTAGRSVGVTLGSLDDVEAVTPTAHGFDTSRPHWLRLADDWPRYPGAPPYDDEGDDPTRD